MLLYKYQRKEVNMEKTANATELYGRCTYSLGETKARVDFLIEKLEKDEKELTARELEILEELKKIFQSLQL